MRIRVSLCLGLLTVLGLAACAPESPGSARGHVALGASSAGLTLAWTDNADNEKGFHVERRPGAAAAWSQIASLEADATGYTDGDVDPGAEYCYRVRAFNDAGNSDWTNEACATARALDQDGGGSSSDDAAGRRPEASIAAPDGGGAGPDSMGAGGDAGAMRGKQSDGCALRPIARGRSSGAELGGAIALLFLLSFRPSRRSLRKRAREIGKFTSPGEGGWDSARF